MPIDAATIARAPRTVPFDATLIVLAKSPLPGHVKTRLSPPFEPHQAAALAEAALIDTLAVAAELPVRHRRIALDGAPGRWLPDGFDVVAQSDGDLARRLASAFGALDGPALLIGMDTPQLDSQLLTDGLIALTEREFDAVLGPTVDGGYWTIGLRAPRPDVFDGVPMSTSHTYTRQLERLLALGLRTYRHRTLRDVDFCEDAEIVASLAPQTAFAAQMRRLRR